jgi:hypothetical protein
MTQSYPLPFFEKRPSGDVDRQRECPDAELFDFSASLAEPRRLPGEQRDSVSAPCEGPCDYRVAITPDSARAGVRG